MRVLLLVPPSENNENVVRDLIYGSWCKGKRIGGTNLPPLSLLQIASVLKQIDCDVRIIDTVASGKTIEDLCIDIINYDLVIFSTSAITLQSDLFFIDKLKNTHSGLKVILFGYYPTYNSRYLLSFSLIDIIVRNEPEHIIRDLIMSLNRKDSWQGTAGIAYCLNGKYVENPPYSLIENLDILPFPDRESLVEQKKYFNPVVKKMPYTLMLTSRGCSGSCTYCTSPIFYGSKVRLRSVANVIDELRLIKKLGYKEVFFRDELFTFSEERTLSICSEMIKAKLEIKWVCSTRADFLNKELLRIMQTAGCHMVRMGVESGNQKLLDNAKKGLNLTQISNAFNWCNDLGIETHAHLIVGIPGENKETLKKTMSFVRKIDPTIVTFGVLIPYKGTELFQKLLDENPMARIEIENNALESVLSGYLTDFSSKQLMVHIKKCYFNFYLRPKYFLKRIVACNSLAEFKRIIFAASNIIGFIFEKK